MQHFNFYYMFLNLVIIFYMTWYTINCDKISREIFLIYDFELNYTRYDNTIFSIFVSYYIMDLQALKNKYDIIGNDPALNEALETAVKLEK